MLVSGVALVSDNYPFLIALSYYFFKKNLDKIDLVRL
jgi:hypothetical protein